MKPFRVAGKKANTTTEKSATQSPTTTSVETPREAAWAAPFDFSASLGLARFGRRFSILRPRAHAGAQSGYGLRQYLQRARQSELKSRAKKPKRPNLISPSWPHRPLDHPEKVRVTVRGKTDSGV